MDIGHKEFLNTNPEETGYVAWNVNNEPEWRRNPTDLAANFTIADCRRSIRLDFNVYGDITNEDRVKKVDEIIRHLTDFKDTILLAKT